MGFGHRSRASAQTTNERTYDVLPNPDIFKSYRQRDQATSRHDQIFAMDYELTSALKGGFSRSRISGIEDTICGANPGFVARRLARTSPFR